MGNNLCIFSPRRGRPSSTSQGWRWSTRCPRRSTFPRNRIRSRWSLERCSLLQGEAGNEQLVSLLTSTPPRPRGTSRSRACSPPPTCRCSSSPPRSLRSSSSRTLPESHRGLDVHKSLPEAQQNQGIPLSVQASSHSRPASGASGSYDSETYQVPDGVKIKDEPDDHLSLSGSDYGSEGMKSPPMNTTGMSPIDMETQEKIKLDRKRQRNRLAASKCRKRKLERISQLDDRVSALKNENADLAAVVKKIKAGVALLKQEVIEHVNSGCDIRVAEGANF